MRNEILAGDVTHRGGNPAHDADVVPLLDTQLGDIPLGDDQAHL